jgi:hypothetical protein
MVSVGTKTAADAAWLFNVHPATISRLLARAGAAKYCNLRFEKDIFVVRIHSWVRNEGNLGISLGIGKVTIQVGLSSRQPQLEFRG